MPTTDLGKPIDVNTANEHIKKYLNINDSVGLSIKVFLTSLPDNIPKVKIGKRFFNAISENNAFIFDADIVSRFFDKDVITKPTHFVVCLGGKLKDDPTTEGEATILVAGCIKDEHGQYKTIPGLDNKPVSEHPGKTAIPELIATKDGASLVFFVE